MTPFSSTPRKNILAALLIASVLTAVNNANAQAEKPTDPQTAEQLRRIDENIRKLQEKADWYRHDAKEARERMKEIKEHMNKRAEVIERAEKLQEQYEKSRQRTAPPRIEQLQCQNVPPPPSPGKPRLEPVTQLRNRLASDGLDQLIQLSRPAPDRISITERRNISPSDAEKIVQIVKTESAANPGVVIEVPCSIALPAGQ